jgi:hypothetical protein
VLSAVELCKGGREEMTIQFSSGRQAGRQFWTRVGEGRTWAGEAEEFIIIYLFKLQMDFYPVAVVLQ